MIDYTYGDLFKQDSIDKQLILEFENGETLTNSDIYQEEATITESICSSTDLEFGNCEASVFKVKVANSFESHIGQTVKVSVVLDGNTDEPFVYGTYKVTSDKPTADRNYREIEAYDSLYEVINSDVAEWYETLMPLVTSTCTLLQFRTSFFNYFGIEQVDTTLVNDDMEITKTVSSTTLSGKDVLKNIMSINGCFGHMNRDNKFEYVFLGDVATDLTDYYSDCTYEDYLTETIDTIQIRQDTDDGGVVYGSGDNVYIIEANFLVYDKNTDELTEIATNLYSLIGNISYRPATVTAKGNPCLEVGDKITLTTKYETIDTFILQRTLKGIQALTDTYTATGSEEFSTSVNSVTSTLNQLAGKTQSLTISLEETKNEMSSISTTLGEKIDDSYSELYGYVETLNSEYSDLQSQIDGAIETWFYDYTPTTSNYPASSWTDDTEKAKHIGDLFYIIGDSESAGQAYRYALVDEEYQWILIEDTAVTKALADAAEAKDIADGKRRVFTDTPYPPYDEGDLWTQGETGDILTCTTAKTSSGIYSKDDWSKLNKYTDDTVAIEVKTDLANNYMTTTQTESAISQTSDKILSTVSTTYTTKEVTEENYNSTITNVEVLYALGTSSETAPTSGWSTTAPDWQDGYYMWQKTVTTYGDNYSTVESDATCLTGATGNGISSVVAQFYLSSSKTTQTGGSWSTTAPAWQSGYYVWTRTVITYTDGTTTTTTPIVDSSWEVANEVETTLTSQIEQTCSTITLSVSNGTTSSGITITGKNLDGDTVATASGTIEMTGLVSFTDLSTSGSTTINGANITTGTIVGVTLRSETGNNEGDYGVELDDGQVNLFVYGDSGSGRARTGEVYMKDNSFYITTGYTKNFCNGELVLLSQGYGVFDDTKVSIGYSTVDVEGSVTTTNGNGYYSDNTSGTHCWVAGMNSSNQYLFGTTSYATYIRGSSIYMNGAVTTSSDLTTTGNVTVKGGLLYIRDTSNTAYGYIGKYAPSEGNGLMFHMQSTAALAITPVSSSNSTPRVWTNYLGHVQPPVTSTYTIGNSSYRYSTYYAVNALNTSSDRNDKHDIAEFTETHEALFEKLQPVTFMRNDGDRTHFGFISQDVFASMEEIGMTDMDFAGFCRDIKVEHKQVETGELDEGGNPIMEEIDEPILDEDGNEQYAYSLRYEEFVSLNTHMIQKYHADETAEIESLKSTIADLQAENETLKSEIAQIKEALGIS